MIFKQLPTAISDLNKLGIALKSLDAMNIGSVGVNTANLEVYRTALKGLSVEQSVFALDSKGATEEQIRQILVTNQAIAEVVKAAIKQSTLNEEQIRAILTKKGLKGEISDGRCGSRTSDLHFSHPSQPISALPRKKIL